MFRLGYLTRDDRGADTSGMEFAVVDVETTGLDPDKDRIVEVAVVRIAADGRLVGAASSLVNPEMQIPVDAIAVHQIRNKDVAHAPTFAEIAADLSALLDGAVVVTHNMLFDGAFLAAESARAGVISGTLPALCTQITAYSQLMDTKRKLKSLYLLMCRRRLTGVHTALADAQATAAILEELLCNSPTPLRYVGDVPSPAAEFSWPVPKTFVPREQTEISWERRRAKLAAGPIQWHQHWQPRETPAESVLEWREAADTSGIDTVTPPVITNTREEALARRSHRIQGFGRISDYPPAEVDKVIDRVTGKFRAFKKLSPERQAELRQMVVARLKKNGGDLAEAYEYVRPEAMRRWACPRDVKMHRVGMPCDTMDWSDEQLKRYLQHRLRNGYFAPGDPLRKELQAALSRVKERMAASEA